VEILSLPVHKRQFCITRSQQQFGPDWSHIELPDGFILSHQADLPIQRIRSEIGETLIIGKSFSSIPGSTARGDLAGRFAILDWPHLQTDAAGLMALYYGGAEHRPFVTSSPALAAKLQGAEDLVPIQLKWKVGLNWVPSPGSKVAGVARLLRDQELHIPTSAVEFFPRPVTPLGSFEEARQVLTSGLTHVLSQIEKSHTKVFMALTGGLDSRTLFAALLVNGIKFEAITQSFPGVNPNDVKVAADLCRFAGVRHRVVPMEEPDVSAAAALSLHTADSSDDADQHYLVPGNSYRFLQKDDAVIRGGCFEIGRHFYHHRLGELDLSDATGEQVLSKFTLDANVEMIQFLDRWLEWRRTHKNGLDLTDNFYLDQRLGGWLSAIEQTLDVVPGTSVQPVNCERFFSCLIAPMSEEERRAGALQREVVRHLDSNLLKIPINPISAGERLRNLARTTKRRLKSALQWAQYQ
jgi:hypothetical protein